MNFDIYDVAIKIHVNMDIFIGNIVNTPTCMRYCTCLPQLIESVCSCCYKLTTLTTTITPSTGAAYHVCQSKNAVRSLDRKTFDGKQYSDAYE